MATDIMNLCIKNIFTKHIDFADDTFRISNPKPLAMLIDSVKDTGVLNPSILIANNSRFRIIAGFRRIEACIKAGLEEIYARVLPENTEFSICVKMAISDNSFERELDLTEQARAFALLSGCCKDKKEISEIAKRLNLPSALHVIEKIMKINDMPDFIRDAIEDKTLALPVAIDLMNFSIKEMRLFTDFFAGLQTSLNRQRHMIELIEEISAREDISISDLLEKDGEIVSVLENVESDNKKKTKTLIEILTKRRYPVLTKTKTEFEKFVKSLDLGENIKLVPPPNFESRLYTLNIAFENTEDLNAHKATLESLISAFDFFS